MKNQMLSAQRVATATMLVALAGATACDIKNELLQPQNPGVVDQTAVGSPSSAAALKIGAMGALKRVVSDPSVAGFAGSSMWEASALMSDEYMNSDFQNSQNDVDARAISPDNQVSNYVRTTQARGYIRDAITAENTYEPTKTADIAELWMALGFIEETLAENLCNGIPLGFSKAGVVDYSAPDFKPKTDAEVFNIALTHYDSALTLLGSATSTDAVAVRNATLIAKARTLVDLGRFADAAALVPTSAIPTSYQYVFITQGSSNSDDLGFWTLNNSIARMSVGDSVVNYGGKQYTTLNAIPFASMNDPRVPVVSGLSLKLPAEDGGQTPLFVQQIYKGRDDPIAMVAGVDARLIEAEAKLNLKTPQGIADMMTILNALRAAPPKLGNFQPATMAALPTPATQDAAVNLFFREKALWQYSRGQRLSDLRRLVRQYGRAQNTVYPSGQQYKGVPYGSDTAMPVPDAERVNPQFNGCIDKNA
jgi:hypothetical protein